MSEKPTHEFKIRLDDSAADNDDASKSNAPKAGSVRDKRRVKTGRNFSWGLSLLILLVVAAMVLGYLDIRSRLLTVHSSGSMETQHLSEDLQSKFSSLGIKISNMESAINTLAESQSALTQSLSSVKENLAKTGKSVSDLASSKADKKSTGTSIANIEKQLSSLTESIKKNTADTAVMSAKLTATLTEMNNLSAKVSENLNALKATMDAIQSDKASKKDLLTEIDHIENVLKTNQVKNDKQAASVLQSIQRLDMRTNAIEVKVGLPTPFDNSASPVGAKGSASGETTVKPTAPSLPEPGGLIERDITQ